MSLILRGFLCCIFTLLLADAASACPLPQNSSEIRYDPTCWVEYDVIVSIDQSFEQKDNGRGRGKLRAQPLCFVARLRGYAWDRAVFSSLSLAASRTSSCFVEWHNLTPPNGATGGRIRLQMTGKGQGKIDTTSHAAAAYGLVWLKFESNALGSEVWEGQVSGAASTSSAQQVSVSYTGQSGAGITIPLHTVMGTGTHPATPFDLGTKRKKACDDEFTFNQVSIVVGRIEANGNAVLFRTGRVELCMTAWMNLQVRLTCGCS